MIQTIGRPGEAEKHMAYEERHPTDNTPETVTGDIRDYADLPVEIGAGGRSTDVELEPTTDARITSPFDPDRIDIQSRSMTVDLLLSRLRGKMIDLAPDFQRKAGIWSDRQQSSLIESLLLRIPIPSFYAAEHPDGSWAIVDGIQRLTAITHFIQPESVGSAPLRLTGLEYLPFEDALFGGLPGRLQVRLRETEVVVNVIRQGTPQAVMYNIFARINTGGLPLTRQELRHALIPGSARTVLAELANSTEFKTATGGSVSDERMADREMVLRFLGFRMSDPSAFKEQDFDAFLARSMREINEWSPAAGAEHRDAFLRAMRLASELFDDLGFRKRRRGQSRRSPVNKALFEATSVCLSHLEEAEINRVVRRAHEIREGFYALMDDVQFDRAISIGTGDPAKVRYRFGAVRELIDRSLGT